jgi:hypothetical protein
MRLPPMTLMTQHPTVLRIPPNRTKPHTTLLTRALHRRHPKPRIRRQFAGAAFPVGETGGWGSSCRGLVFLVAGCFGCRCGELGFAHCSCESEIGLFVRRHKRHERRLPSAPNNQKGAVWGRLYLIGNGIHLCKRMDNSFSRFVFRTPHPRRHNPILPPKSNHTNHIPSTPLHRRNIKPHRKPRRSGTADVHGQLAVVAVDDCAAGFVADGAGGCPAVRGDGSYSLDGFECFGVCEAGFGVEEGAGYMGPVVICRGFQGGVGG